MNFFAVYDPTTGAIKRAGYCSAAADVALQAKAGEAVIAANSVCDGSKFSVDITKTPPTIVTKGSP